MSTAKAMDADDMRAADWGIISVLREGRANAPLIADETEYSAQYVRERLGRLKQDDIVRPLGHGLYAVEESEVPPMPPDVEREFGDEIDAPAVDVETRPEPAPDRTREVGTESVDTVDGVADVTAAAVAANDELPETVAPAAAAEAVEAVLVWLRPQGSASKSDIVRGVMPEHPLGYDDAAALETIAAGERYRGAWWRRVVRETLREHPAAEQHGTEWRYVGGAGDADADSDE